MDHADRPVDRLSDALVADFAVLDPVSASSIGLPADESAMTDLSPEGYAARTELFARALREVAAAEPTDEREQIAQESFLERVGLHQELAESGIARSEVSVIVSGAHDVREVFDLMPTETEQDWLHIRDRLSGVPAALAGWQVTLQQAAAEGHVSARRQYVEVAAQIDRWTTPGSSVFDQLVAQADGVPEELAAELRSAAAAATAALAASGDFLAQQMAPLGRERDAVGADHYALCSRRFLGARIDPLETYAWGWEELARLHADMQETAGRIVPGGGMAEAVAALESDPDRFIEGRETFRGWMQDLADRTLAEMADTHFDIPEPVRRIECRLAPTQDGGIYYTGPSEDFSRPGTMWWSVPPGIDVFHPWREVTTVYHEGVPGHHLQIGQSAYRSELLNRWQRKMCWVSGHGEGWALYAERLMDELGYLADPADRLGMLDAHTFRAARVIVDIGMHLELRIPEDNPFDFHPGEQWTPELGLEFLREHCSMEDDVLRFERDRYLGWPGQAPSYKVGERLWLEAREEAKARAGAGFDLKAFHRDALNLGSLGLDPFRRAMARL